ncbi:MAG: hypothetical protein KDD99_27190 [Bacteroidetes bacterium]|nr:hypothetical protein [Bacteroidota bacterium]
MSAIEQKIISLFSPLPFSLKAKILANLIQLMTDEIQKAEEKGELVITDDLKKQFSLIKERHAIGKGKTYTKEEFRKHLDNLMSK